MLSYDQKTNTSAHASSFLPVLSDNKDGGAAMCGGHQLQGAQFSYTHIWMKTIYLQSGNFS